MLRTYAWIGLLICFASPLFSQESVVTEELETIQTYPFSDPDPVPVLTRRPAIYPYYAFQKFSSTGEDREWKTIRMENPYIRVLVLPQVGGKVWGASEKSTGHEFIYHNRVLKFRQIAMRGPWTSGGIEFNFGLVGHTPCVATPVDYLLRNNRDGSVSCFVGTMDLASRTRWSVEIRLPQDKAFFETRTLWTNPTPLHQSYYAWSNNAVDAGMDLQYFYPGRIRRPHGYSASMAPWPVDEQDRDLSWYKNNNFGADKSHFVMGEYEDFFGGYWHDKEFGFGHWALYDDMPGKKMWIWALSRQGAIWEDLLTDADGQYSEPQAGRYFSQDDHGLFQPLSSDVWKEILFPYKSIKGLMRANPWGALNVIRNADTLHVGFCALQNMEDTLLVRAGDRILLRQPLNLRPLEAVRLSLPAPGPEVPVSLSIGTKIDYDSRPGKNTIHRPIRYSKIDESTPEGLYLSGQFHEQRRNYIQAEEKYRACLKEEPFHIRAMTRLAELFCRRALYSEALDMAGRALELSMYDPGANYIYGVICRALGRRVDAAETLGWAARSMTYRSNAYCQMAEIALEGGDLSRALEYTRRSRIFNSMNLRAREMLALIHRKMGNRDKAEAVLDSLEQIDPLNHRIRYERYRLSPGPDTWKAFREKMTSEFAHEAILELAVDYARLGQNPEAIELLKRGPGHPILLIWLAYLTRERHAEKARIILDEAHRLSPRLVFPFREESIPVLEWAVRTRPGAWKFKYYLGLVLWSKNRMAEAQTWMKQCGQSDFAPFYLALSHLEPENSLQHLEKALSLEPDQWRTWNRIFVFHLKNRSFNSALETAERAVQRFPGQGKPHMDLANARYHTGDYEGCRQILDTLRVLPYEGGWEAHNLYMRNLTHMAMVSMEAGDPERAIDYLESAKTYPERLGTGRPYDPDCRIQDALLSLALEDLGMTREAEETRERVVAYTLRHWSEPARHSLAAYRMLRRSGYQKQADRLLEEWESGSGNPAMRWLYLRASGRTNEARSLDNSRKTNPRHELTVSAADFMDRWAEQKH